jgi:hypothetical protein
MKNPFSPPCRALFIRSIATEWRRRRFWVKGLNTTVTACMVGTAVGLGERLRTSPGKDDSDRRGCHEETIAVISSSRLQLMHASPAFSSAHMSPICQLPGPSAPLGIQPLPRVSAIAELSSVFIRHITSASAKK